MSETKRTFEYRGHKVEVRREECMGGWEMIYFYITDKHGYELECDFSEGEDTVEDYVGFMKERIDGELKEEHPWGIGSDWISEGDRCIIKDGNLVEVKCVEVSYP